MSKNSGTADVGGAAITIIGANADVMVSESTGDSSIAGSIAIGSTNAVNDVQVSEEPIAPKTVAARELKKRVLPTVLSWFARLGDEVKSPGLVGEVSAASSKSAPSVVPAYAGVQPQAEARKPIYFASASASGTQGVKGPPVLKVLTWAEKIRREVVDVQSFMFAPTV